jgi:hypothetical protein
MTSSPPTASELRDHPVVRATLDQAWLDSLPHDANNRHEEGGWIYLNLSTGEISAVRAKRGMRSHIDLSQPVIVTGSVVVGKFHTHPNPASEGWVAGPSDGDLRIDEIHGVPDLIIAEDGIHLSGPHTRRGGLSGNSGYPASTQP